MQEAHCLLSYKVHAQGQMHLEPLVSAQLFTTPPKCKAQSSAGALLRGESFGPRAVSVASPNESICQLCASLCHCTQEQGAQSGSLPHSSVRIEISFAFSSPSLTSGWIAF